MQHLVFTKCCITFSYLGIFESKRLKNQAEDEFWTFRSINCIFEKYDEIFNSNDFDFVTVR